MAFGVRAGVNIANEHANPIPSGSSVGSAIGFIGGGQLDVWFNSMWAFSGQLLYDQKGAALNFSQSIFGTTVTGTSTIKRNYIEIPLTIKAQFGTGSVKPYVFAGPTIGILLSASVHSVANNGTNSSDTTEDAKSSYTSTDFGILFGAGATFAINPTTSLFVEASYDYGLSNVSVNSTMTNPDGTTTTSNNTENTRDIRLMVGILFGQ
jgi:hypothetical protein